MFNLTKKYNQLLELAMLAPEQRKQSLLRIFNRDIAQNDNFNFRSKKIYPITKEEQDRMETLFVHLTTEKVDYKENKREYDSFRSERLHWIKYHIEENKQDNMLIFSIDDVKYGIRTYIYDVIEKYVIILEPYRNGQSYYLITAYYLQGGGDKNKIESKYKRRLPTIF